MKKNALSWFERLTLLLGVILVLVSSHSSQAVVIASDPLFTKAQSAPLAGILRLNTDVPSRVSISVDDGNETWNRDFYDYDTVHSLPLFGFKPGRTNEITVTVRDRFQNEFTAATPVTFITDPLPNGFPVLNVLISKPELMEPGYTLFRCVNNGKGYITFVDNMGQVVWYSTIRSGNDVRQLSDGNLFLPLPTNFFEVNLLGETVKTWAVPTTLSVDTHDAILTDHDSILYISDDSRVVPDFPTSATDPNARTQTAGVQFDRIVEISTTNQTVLNNWSLIDMLDPLRISYLTFTKTTQGWDAEHANAVIEDPRDNSIIVSLRNQNAIIKFSRATGQIKWILGPHENWSPQFKPFLLTPVGTPFEWNYAQHAPSITPQGTLLLYDDGNFRASPFDASVADVANYSRAVEFEINEQTMEVTQVWEYGRNVSEPLYTGALGIAEWLPQTDHVLVDFGYVSYVNHVHPSVAAPNALMARIKEVTHDKDPEVVFDLAIFDYNNLKSTYTGSSVYRSHRVPDLYGHPAMPITDLNVTMDDGLAHLEFSGDPARIYTIEASTDLEDWVEIATPELGADGVYDFEDNESETDTYRYYRVLTR